MRSFNQAQVDYLNNVESDIGGHFKVLIQPVDPQNTDTILGSSFKYDPLAIKWIPLAQLTDITSRCLSIQSTDQFDSDSPYGNDIPLAKYTSFTVTVDDTDGYFLAMSSENLENNGNDRFVPLKFGCRIVYDDGTNPVVPIAMGVLTEQPIRDERELTYVFNFRDFSVLFKEVDTSNFSYIGPNPGHPEIKARAEQQGSGGSYDPGQEIPAVTGSAAISTNGGSTWSILTNFPTNLKFKAIGFGNGRWRIAGLDGFVGHSDDNGQTWTIGQFSGITEFRRVRFYNNTWAMVSYDGKIFFSSTNGDSWTIDTPGFLAGSDNIYDIAYGAGKWVISTQEGRMWYKDFSGTIWNACVVDGSIPSVGSPAIITIKSINNFFVACGNQSRIYYSNDGVNWTSDANFLSSFPGKTLSALCVTSSKVVISSTALDCYISNSPGVPGSFTEQTIGGGFSNGFAEIVNNNSNFIGAGGLDAEVGMMPISGISWTRKDPPFSGGSVGNLAIDTTGQILMFVDDAVFTDDSTGGGTSDPTVTDPTPYISPVTALPAEAPDLANTYYWIQQEKPVLTGYVQIRQFYEAARQYRIDESVAPVVDVRACSVVFNANPTNEIFLPETSQITYDEVNLTEQAGKAPGATGRGVLGRTDSMAFALQGKFYCQTKLSCLEFSRHIFRVVFTKAATINGNRVKIDANYWDQGKHGSTNPWASNPFASMRVDELNPVHPDDISFHGVVENNQGSMWQALQQRICISGKHYIYFDAEGNFKVGTRPVTNTSFTTNSNGLNIPHIKNTMHHYQPDYTYRFFNRVQVKSKKYQAVNGNFYPTTGGRPTRLFDETDPNCVLLGRTTFLFKAGGTENLKFKTYGLQWIDQMRVFINLGVSTVRDSSDDGLTHEAPYGYGNANSSWTIPRPRPFRVQKADPVTQQNPSGGTYADFQAINTFDVEYQATNVNFYCRGSSVAAGGTIITPPNMGGITVVVPEGGDPVEDNSGITIEAWGYPFRKFPVLVFINDAGDTSISGLTSDQLVERNGFSPETITTPYNLIRNNKDLTPSYLLKFFGNKKNRFNTQEMIAPFWEAGDMNEIVEYEYNTTNILTRMPVMVEKSTILISPDGDVSTGHTLLEWK